MMFYSELSLDSCLESPKVCRVLSFLHLQSIESKTNLALKSKQNAHRHTYFINWKILSIFGAFCLSSL